MVNKKKKIKSSKNHDKQLESYLSIYQCCIVCVITLNGKLLLSWYNIDRPMIIMWRYYYKVNVAFYHIN